MCALFLRGASVPKICNNWKRMFTLVSSTIIQFWWEICVPKLVFEDWKWSFLPKNVTILSHKNSGCLSNFQLRDSSWNFHRARSSTPCTYVHSTALFQSMIVKYVKSATWAFHYSQICHLSVSLSSNLTPFSVITFIMPHSVELSIIVNSATFFSWTVHYSQIWHLFSWSVHNSQICHLYQLKNPL